MKKLFLILFLFPAPGFTQTGDLDTLLKLKLISPATYTKSVYDRLFTQIGTKIGTELDPVWITDKPGYLPSATAAATYSPLGHTHTFASLTSKPTTIAGYGITDAFTQTAADALYASISHTHTFASLTSKPTTIAGYGITDAFTQSTADGLYASLSHTHTFVSLTAKPTTLAGYGITDAAALLHTHTFSSLTSIPTTVAGYGITDAATTTQLGAKADTTRNGSYFLAADFTTSSLTAVSTNLSFPIGANESYAVEIWGHVSKAVNTLGLKLAIAAPTGCIITGTEYTSTTTYSTAQTMGELTAINTLGRTMATAAGVKVPFRMEFTVTNGSTAGFITLQVASVTSNAATVYAGTRLIFLKSRPQ